MRISFCTLCTVLMLCVAGLEIPCTTTANRSTFFVVSSVNYTLTDCVSDLLFIDLAPTQTISITVLENVTVHVVGGNVLPRFRATGSNWVPPSIQNVHVMVDGAHVSHNVTMTTDSEPAHTMLDISGGTITTVIGVSVTFVNASLRLVVGTSNGARVRVAPLMLLVVGGGQGTATLRDVAVVVENSLISVNVSINGASNSVSNSLVAMSSLSVVRSGLMEQIQMSVVNSTLVLAKMSEAPASGFYSGADATLFSVRCDESAANVVELRGVSVVLSVGAKVTVLCRVPRISSDTAAVVSIGCGMHVMEGVTVDVSNTVALVENRCGSDCGVAVNVLSQQNPFPLARVINLCGIVAVTDMRNITVVVVASTMIIDSPKSAVFITVQGSAALTGLLINASDCLVRVSSSELNVGEASRTQVLAEVMSINNATNVQIVVQRITIAGFIESGDCAIAYSSVVGVLDNISHASIHVADVVVTSRIINGTAPILRSVFAALTMTTHIVYVAMYTPAYVNTGVNISITVVNATLDVIHATTLPTGPLYMLVLSTASIVNAVRSLTNCSIAVADSHVVRSPHPSGPPLAGVLPFSGASFNASAVVNLCDVTKLLCRQTSNYRSLRGLSIRQLEVSLLRLCTPT
jgi:hypothetical protein